MLIGSCTCIWPRKPSVAAAQIGDQAIVKAAAEPAVCRAAVESLFAQDTLDRLARVAANGSIVVLKECFARLVGAAPYRLKHVLRDLINVAADADSVGQVRRTPLPVAVAVLPGLQEKTLGFAVVLLHALAV